jgi:hypothetical protein
VRPPGTLPRPTSVGGTVPAREEAGLGPFSVIPQDRLSISSGAIRQNLRTELFPTRSGRRVGTLRRSG